VLVIPRQLNTEVFIMLFFIVANTIQLVIILTSRVLPGDLFPKSVEITNWQVFGLFLVHLATYVAMYKFYVILKNKRLIKPHVRVTSFSLKLLDYAILMQALLHLSFLVTGLIVPVGQEATSSPLTIFLSIFPLDGIFYLYYVFRRTNKPGKIYIVNTILFLLFQLQRGMTGDILILFFVELYLRKKHIGVHTLVLIPFLFFLGTFAYSFMYSFKIAIRSQSSFSLIRPLSFASSFALFIGRTSMVGNLVGIFEKSRELVEAANSLLPDNFLIFRFFRALIPSFIATRFFPKNVETYGLWGGLLFRQWYSEFVGWNLAEKVGSSFGTPALGVLYLTFLRNPLEMFFYILFVALLVLYFKLLIDFLNRAELNFLLFFRLLFFVHESGEPLIAFSKFFVALTSLTIFLLLLTPLTNGSVLRNVPRINTNNH